MSKLNLLKMADKTEEGIEPEEIIENQRNKLNKNKFVSDYKNFYNDIKTKVREDW